MTERTSQDSCIIRWEIKNVDKHQDLQKHEGGNYGRKSGWDRELAV